MIVFYRVAVQEAEYKSLYLALVALLPHDSTYA